MKVAILGRGNVASHLKRALSPLAPDIETIQCDPHRPGETPADADFVIIAVSDSAIPGVASGLPSGLKGIVVHTSGSVPMSTLKVVSKSHQEADRVDEVRRSSSDPRIGVLYPLMTLSKDKEIDYTRLPLLTEGDSPETLKAIDSLASLITRQVSHADSDDRARLHLGAVFACNFTNLMCRIASDLLVERGLDLQMLLPLVEETVAKLRTMDPREAQTGPASRGDTEVMRRQYEVLASHPDYRDIYALLSHAIQAG